MLLVIRNVLGQEFYSKGFVLDKGLFITTVCLSSEIHAGIYFIIASSEECVLEKKIIIK